MLVLLKMILQLLLFVVFLYMYGLPALERLNKKSTIVIKTRKNTDGIEAPSFTISARSNTTGMGWKEKQISNGHSNDTLVHQCKDFDTVEQCLDSQTFNRSEIIKGALLGYERKLSLMEDEGVWEQDFTYVRFGRSYTFQPNTRIGPEDNKEQLILLLDNKYIYDIFVHEKDILNDNRYTLPPSIYIRLIPDASNHFKMYYKISATQHIEMNVPEDPCVEDDQYSFGVCVKESLTRRIGCRPSWDVWSDQAIRICTKIDEHR